MLDVTLFSEHNQQIGQPNIGFLLKSYRDFSTHHKVGCWEMGDTCRGRSFFILIVL